MAKPPVYPVQVNNKNMNYFDILVSRAQPYLKEEGITINFDGYNNVVYEYSTLNIGDLKKAEELTISLNGWSEYISTLANLIQNSYLDSETDKISIQSRESIDYSNKNVSAGERYANTTEDVIAIRKKRNVLKSLYDELVSKTKFLERAHYHCKSICDWKYRTNQSYVKQY